jgi:hypothetical protein
MPQAHRSDQLSRGPEAELGSQVVARGRLLDGTRSGREAAGLIAVEMGRAAAPIEAAVRATLTRLRASEVVLGTHR